MSFKSIIKEYYKQLCSETTKMNSSVCRKGFLSKLPMLSLGKGHKSIRVGRKWRSFTGLKRAEKAGWRKEVVNWIELGDSGREVVVKEPRGCLGGLGRQ